MRTMVAALCVIAFCVSAGQADWVVISTNTTIDSSNAGLYEGQDLLVSGCQVTINVPLTLHRLEVVRNEYNQPAVVTHAPGLAGGLQLTIQTELLIQGPAGSYVGSRIDVGGKGHPANEGPGAGGDCGYFGAGGGYGGVGGNSTGGCIGGGTYGYGSRESPTELGSGGGAANGGAGGGALKLSVGGLATIDGTLSAAGDSGNGGGSGGSLWFVVGTLAGQGSITANGGNGEDGFRGSGGGGRLALYYATNNFQGTISAWGGNVGHQGGAGTMFIKAADEPKGRLVIDNHDYAGGVTPVLSCTANMEIVHSAWVYPPAALVVNGNLQITTGGRLFPVSRAAVIDVTVIGDLQVDGTSHVDADGYGYVATQGPGAGTDSAQGGFGSGAGYGGNGGSCGGGPGGQAYGSIMNPVDFGSGGGASDGGAGGGAVKLNITGAATIFGAVTANGNNGNGGGSGGSVWLTCATLAGGGAITANGGNSGDNNRGSGGGGRVALYYTTNTFAGSASAFGGGGAHGGGAGTIYTRAAGQPRGTVLIDNNWTSGAATPVPSCSADMCATRRTWLIPQGVVTVGGNLEILDNARVTPAASLIPLDLSVVGNLTLASGCEVSASGYGYPHGQGPGAGTDNGYGYGSGAGYGGRGGNGGGGPGGAVYGSVSQPVDQGSGGGSWDGGTGGGAIRLNVSGSATLGGSVAANGNNGGGYGGGGSGGSIWITSGALSGGGSISACGGNAPDGYRGSGGGGRIALYCCNNQLGPAQISVQGGHGGAWGADGTIFRGSTYLTITQQPVSQLIRNGGPVSFTVEVSDPLDGVQYCWQKDGVELVEDARVTGVHTATLHITHVVYPVDQGAYRVWLTDSCGDGVSQAAQLTIAPCSGDCDCDARVNFSDIDYFVAAIPDNQASWAALYAARHGGVQPTCPFVNCDINTDGHVNFADIDPFVALIPSSCP